MNSTNVARSPGDEITAGIPAIDHHSHAAYVRRGETNDGVAAAEREIAASMLETSLPHDDYLALVDARLAGDRATLDALEQRYGIEELTARAVREHSTTVFVRALYEGARALHGDLDDAALRTISRDRNHADPVSLYDRALDESGTQLVLTDVPSIDRTAWPEARYRQVMRVDPYLYPFGHPTFRRRGSDTPRFRRVFASTLLDQLEVDGLDVRGLSFDDYVQFMIGSIHRRRREGVVGMKIASAYVRSLHFVEPSIHEARSAYEAARSAPGELQPTDHETLANYLVFQAADVALELELPLQIHVGHGHAEPGLLLRDANPLLLEPLLSTPRLNSLPVILIHGGFPFSSYLTALALTYGNVHIDYSWMPILHERVLDRALEEWLEYLPARKILHGTDTGSPEFHHSATTRSRAALERVLGAGVRDGRWSAHQVEEMAERVLGGNARTIYALGSPA